MVSRGSRRAPELSPWGLLAVIVSLAFLAGGTMWPGVAESLLRILLIGLALGWAAARALGIGLPTAWMHDSWSPFESDLAELPPPSIPDVVRRRARALSAVDDPERGTHRPIPGSVARDLADETARRLETLHGLRPGRPKDASRIRAMVSQSTWTLLGLRDADGPREDGGVGDRTIPFARLDDIIDDLERL
jgi:hypothetical protein